MWRESVDARRPDRRRFSRTPLRTRPATRGGDPDLDRHALDSGGAAARHVDGFPGRRRRVEVHGLRCSARRSSASTSSPAAFSAPPTSTSCSWPSSSSGFALVAPMAMALAGGWDAIAADPSRHRSLRRRLAAIGLAAALLPRPGVRRVAGADPESLRRARRARGHDRHRAERRGADGLRGAADAHRDVGARPASRHRQGPGVRDDGERTDAGVWRARAGGRVLGRSERRRRRALHAGDVRLARSLSPVAPAATDRDLLRAARVSAIAGARPRARAGDDAPVGHRRARHVLRRDGRDAVRAAAGWPVFAPRTSGARAWPRLSACQSWRSCISRLAAPDSAR